MMKFMTRGCAILALSMPVACGNIYNSSTSDSTKYGVADGSSQFLAAKAIINTSCSSCHTHAAWTGMTEAQYVEGSLVTPGSLENSVLYTKIIGNRTAIAGNMPLGGTPLTNAELDTLETWILSITP